VLAATDAIEQGIAANAIKRPSAVSADTVRGQNVSSDARKYCLQK
jgi:hypothetical protein